MFGVIKVIPAASLVKSYDSGKPDTIARNIYFDQISIPYFFE